MAKKFLDITGLERYHNGVVNALNEIKEFFTTKIDNIVNGTTVVAKATNAVNAENAAKATQDSEGNIITVTYATKDEMTSSSETQGGNITALANRVTETENNISTLNKKVSTTEGDILITNTNVTNIVNGTTVVAKATDAVNAENAAKATQDGEGNVIADTYVTTAEVEEMISNIDTGGSVSGDYLPLTGGTLTGNLYGEDAVFDNMYVNGEFIVGGNDDLVIDEYGNISVNDGYGLMARSTSSAFGFNQDGEPTFHNAVNDRHFNYASNSIDDPNDCYSYELPAKDGTIALTSDIPKYYIHTINVYNTSSTTYQIAFTAISTSATAYTKSTIYTAFPSKVFACSGYYGSNVAFKIVFTASGTARIVYGSGGSTVTTSIANFTDTVIPIP